MCPSFTVIGEKETNRKIYVDILNKDNWLVLNYISWFFRNYFGQIRAETN